MNDATQSAPDESPPVIRLPEAVPYVPDTQEAETPNQRLSRRSSLGLLATMAAMMGATLPGLGSPRIDKNAPDYEKTPEDIARLEAARRKRERRADRDH